MWGVFESEPKCLDIWDIGDIPSGGSRNFDHVIGYTTGFGSLCDYWYVQFKDNGGTHWCTGDWLDFYCSITSDDEGGTVKFTLNGGDKELDVDMPESSDCYEGMEKGQHYFFD